MKIIAIVPAWNVEKYIAKVVTELKAEVMEVIVVDDASSDNTAKEAKQAGAIVLRHLINRYQGAALRTGTDYVLQGDCQDNDIIIHFDGDDQMRAQDIPKVIAPLIAGQADISFGSRFLDQSTEMPFLKKIIIMPLARLVNGLMGVKLTDPQSGFRAFTVKTAKQLTWQQDGPAHCSEILVKAHQQKLRITEAPVTIIYHRFGNNFLKGLGIIWDLLLAKLIN